MKNVILYARDSVAIAGNLSQPTQITKRLLALHAMPDTKESYLPLMTEMEPLGWQVLAIDFRGHGQSTQNSALDYHSFQPADHQKYSLDARAAYDYLATFGPIDAVIGASVGANVAAMLQAELAIPASVLISAGTDYYGLKPGLALGKLTASQRVYMIATTSDERTAGTAGAMAEVLYQQIATANKKIDVYPGTEHGLEIITNHSDRLAKIISFLQD